MTPKEIALKIITMREGQSWNDDPDWYLRTVTEWVEAAMLIEREACANIHQNIDPSCDHEKEKGLPGAAAMGAIIKYRDAIRERGGK
jgi:hypothetical protein